MTIYAMRSYAMRNINKQLGSLAASALFCLSGLTFATSASAELLPEVTPAVEKLAADYPDSMVFVHDANFDALIAGRVILVDVATDNRNYKGALDAAQFASFIENSQKNELYVGETFFSRGTRGIRTDVISIYDKQDLKRLGEILLPGGKRGQYVSHRYTMQLVDNDRYMLLFNFTPAASVRVIDLDKREILSETQIPGCGLIYPTGKRGFTSLCSNGSMFTAQFDKQGQLSMQEKIAPFFDVDEDALFDKPVYINGTAWFPSFKGDLQAVDLSGKLPLVGERWSMLSTTEKAENWRPGGWQIASVDDAGHIYMLMHKNGIDGSHKGGGTEVWVFDPKQKKRIKRFELKTLGVSIEVTRGKQPHLVVTNGNMQLDVYDANSGEYQRLIGGIANTPFNLHALR